MTIQLVKSISDKEIIRTARQEKTLREFANLLRVTYGAVFQWETGATRPSLDRIKEWMSSRNPEVAALGKALFELRKSEAEAAFNL